MVIQVNLRDKKDASIIQAILQADAAGIPRSALVRQWYEGSINGDTPTWAKQLLRQQQEILEKLNNGISLNGKQEVKEDKIDLGGLWDED